MDCVHLTPPDPTRWEYTGFVVVVVVELTHQVPYDFCLEYYVRNEFVGYYLQYDLHVWLAKCQWVEAVQFCKQHPEATWDILMYCLCGAVDQSFIFLTISRFGSLTNTTITTMRKFVSIVVSSVLSGNPLSTKQWSSVIMVFSGLSYQIYLKWKKLQRMPKKKSTQDIIDLASSVA
ncbi:UDP-galactose/UDP-glucose transporter 3 [Capsicum baccatum]|uniref:UDP-galactose/UDP-glucose transporter 3 n=1 Tax=Capsicum baccatum TaxID=33114 RepID=A0A2G2XPV8_CAPBA|nr:UDP-galactose/UDP-glucose transporter 3 [Capsicum baccatum]